MQPLNKSLSISSYSLIFFLSCNSTYPFFHARFYPDQEKRACESIQDAENKTVTLLQNKFLSLLADFRYTVEKQLIKRFVM